MDTPSFPLPFRVVVLVRVVATMSCVSRPSPLTFGTRYTSVTVPVSSPTRNELMVKAASRVSVTPESVTLSCGVKALVPSSRTGAATTGKPDPPEERVAVISSPDCARASV